MVNQFDPHGLTHFYDPLRYLNILSARLEYARRMVVDKDDRRCTHRDSGAEDLSRMDNVGVDSANRNDFIMDNLVVAIEVETAQVLLSPPSHVERVFEGLT